MGAALAAVAVAVLCAVLLHRRRAAAALAAKMRQESQGVAMDQFSHDDGYGMESGVLAPPGPGHRGLWFYEQLHASLVSPPPPK